MTWDFYRFRADMQTDLATQAQLVLDNTAAAVTFNDPDAAGETLEMLEIHPHTQIACLYLAGRHSCSRFAAFRRPRTPARPAPPPGLAWRRNRMFVTEQLLARPRPGARLTIGVDLEQHRARIRTQATAVAAILVAGLLVSCSCLGCCREWWRGRSAHWPTRRAASPIAATTRSAPRSPTGDEIGVLVQAFNRMLDEIQASQRERAELLDREQQANRLKDEFLATLSHELRTPLNAIVGWVHLLRRGQLPAEEAKHALERIDRNAHAQARLVQDLLDVSRITSGKLLLDIREMDLATVALNAIDACRPAAEARQVSLVTRVQPARSRRWAIRIGCSRCSGT